MVKYIIALTKLGIKNVDIIKLLIEYKISDIASLFDSCENKIITNDLNLLRYYEIFLNRKKVEIALSEADLILSINKQHNIKTSYYGSSTYPKNLAKVTNPPAIIYYKGDEFDQGVDDAIACVGTRKPTKLSYNAVNYLVPQWVNEGCCIVSGLACGVDKLSHQSCITSNGKTIAVLAHGLDTIYPKENAALSERILQTGGILMSEYPVGIKPDRYRFVNRNRLIVGLSKAIAIFECDIKGGTMHNVEYAKRQNKPIFCPAIGNDIVEIQTGTKKLLDENIAIEIKDGRDIKNVLYAVDRMKLNKRRMSAINIKIRYLKSLIQIINEPNVLDISLAQNNIRIDNSNDIEKTFVDLVNYIASNSISIDSVINSIVENNISSIAKTLTFPD